MIRIFAAVSALAWCCSACALDGASLELGRGDENSKLARAGLEWDWHFKRPLPHDVWWGGYWELSLGGWRNGEGTTDLAFTPVFRAERPTWGVLPYIEGAIGLHLLSHVELDRQRTSGSRLQFGDHFGVGVRFGEHLQHDIGVRVQHLSNGGFAAPNPGIEFGIVRYEYRFD